MAAAVIMATSYPAWRYSWEVTGEKKQFAICIAVQSYLYCDFKTPFGTIREHRNGPDHRPCERLELLIPNIDFLVDDTLDQYSDVTSRIDGALSKLLLDSHTGSDELRQSITDVVLIILRRYTEGYDTAKCGSVVYIDVEEERVKTVKISSFRSYFESYVRVGTVDGIDDSCPICMDDFLAGDEIGHTECGHSFHFRCIARWICDSLFCPMCRTSSLGTVAEPGGIKGNRIMSR
ncbi:hypothetical protein H6P81_000255 [Aristolochia fimbriata]|uniref:RING-type E3 ubiquitin transferase n=1 Tax=Aristolochia fimbriata TaxID=158543 RepID=A0AAV7F7I8_ARIFI|nr:hypothetical protein H6P81_000255 [Aristolochia fimbriata]